MWLAGLLLAVFLFLLPILLGWHGIFLDDVAIHYFPNQIFQARCLQQGIIPLWDPHTHAGGQPFYLRQEDYAFYPVQWFFGLWGAISPSTRSLRDLIIIPIIAHILWGALGAYVLGRWGLKFSRPGAAMAALLFAFSTSQLGGIGDPVEAISMPWQPWLVAAVLLYARKRRTAWIIFGAVVLAMGAPTWTANTIHGLILAAYFGLILLGLRWKEEGRASVLKLLAGLLAMGLIGLLLSAPFWLAAIESWHYIEATLKTDYRLLTSGPRSLPWRWLVTIFVPELFGKTNFTHLNYWGVAHDYEMIWNEARLTRGMLIWFPTFLAIWTAAASWCKRIRSPVRAEPLTDSTEAEEPWPGVPSPGKDGVRYSLWTWAAAGLIVLSIFLMAGRFSPAFGWLYQLGPFFRVPYATRWHTFYTMGLSILTGIGVSRILGPGAGRVVITRMRVIVYLFLATLVPLAGVMLPNGYWERVVWEGVLKAPFLYWLVCVVLLFVIGIWWRPRWIAKAVVILFLAGLFRSAYWDTYRFWGNVSTSEKKESFGPEANNLFRFMALASQYDPGPLFRTGYSRVFADTAGLIYGSYSLLGSGVKPMIPRMYHTLSEISSGMPYQTALRDSTIPFVRNMSVGYWWYDRPQPPEEDWVHVASAPEFGLYLFRVAYPQPRVFTLDRLEAAGEEEQCQALINRELREVVVIDTDDETARRYLVGRDVRFSTEHPVKYFSRLQEANRLIRSDFSNPNRVELDLEVTYPAMLVITDAWHPDWRATDNGREVTIHRVNYIQRGIWLEAGSHKVKMEFCPVAVRVGRWFFLTGVAAAVFLLLCRRRIDSGKAAGRLDL